MAGYHLLDTAPGVFIPTVNDDDPLRTKFVHDHVLAEVYDDDKSDEEIIIDGFWNMFEREEEAFARYRAERKKRRGR